MELSYVREAVQAAGGPLHISNISEVPLSTLQGYLRGGEMKFSNLLALSAACGFDLNWLATGDGPMSGQPPGASTASEKPQNSASQSAFGSINPDRLASALEAASLAFDKQNARPTMRELAMVTLLLYDAAEDGSQKR